MANGDVAMQTSTAPAVHGETQLAGGGQQSSAAAPEPAKYHGRYRQVSATAPALSVTAIRDLELQDRCYATRSESLLQGQDELRVTCS